MGQKEVKEYMELYEWSTLAQIAEACGQSNDTVQVYLNKMYKRGEVVFLIGCRRQRGRRAAIRAKAAGIG